jgi:hypothetical protein
MEAADLIHNGVDTPSGTPTAVPAGEAAASPPALRIAPWIRASSFVHEDAGHFARLTIVGQLRPGARPPKTLKLIASCRDARASYRPVSVSIDRRQMIGDRRHAGLRLVLTFDIPAVLLEGRNVEFGLLAGNRGEIGLPFPALASVPVRAPRLSVGVVASAAALGVGALLLAPAASVADATPPAQFTTTDTTSTGTTPATTPATTTPTGTTPATTPATTTSPTTTSLTTTMPTTTTPTPTTTTPTTTTPTTPTPTTTTPTTTTPTTTTPTKTTPKPPATGSGAAKSITAGIIQGSASMSVTGTVRKTKALKSRNGNAAKPVVLAPTPQPAPTTSTPIAAVLGSTDLWGGSSGLLANPFTQLELERFAAEAARMTNPPKYLVHDYQLAARRYRLPWEVLAAINYIETGYGRDLAVSPAGAVGWMQFMPSTWAEYGEAVTARGRIMPSALGDPWLPRDAIFSAAHLLVADGARKNLAKAVYSYNHAQWYVQEVLTLAARITSKQMGKHIKPKARVRAMLTMARLLDGIGYTWGGGHTTGDWIVQPGYDCSGFVSAVLHAGGYLQFPQDTQTLPGQQGIAQGPGKFVTIYDRTDAGIGDDHVIIDLNGDFWEEGGGGPSGAAMVHQMRGISGAYIRSFNVVLHPQGL